MEVIHQNNDGNIDEDFEEISKNKAKKEKRIFGHFMRENCWQKSRKVPFRDPSRWRFDSANNPVCKQLIGCFGVACYEFDHVIPYSKGGKTEPANCQILQTKANRLKADKIIDDVEELKYYSARISNNIYLKKEDANYWSNAESSTISRISNSGIGNAEMDLIEMAIYGDVRRNYSQDQVSISDSGDTMPQIYHKKTADKDWKLKFQSITLCKCKTEFETLMRPIGKNVMSDDAYVKRC